MYFFYQLIKIKVWQKIIWRLSFLKKLYMISCFHKVMWTSPETPASTCSKCSNDSVQDKGIERGIECISFECFNQVRIERSIRVSRGDPSTSYPCARGVQHNLI